jgi:hypothetical protein
VSTRHLLWSIGVLVFVAMYMAAVNVTHLLSGQGSILFVSTNPRCSSLWNPIEWFRAPCSQRLPERLGVFGTGIAVLLICAYLAERTRREP